MKKKKRGIILKNKRIYKVLSLLMVFTLMLSIVTAGQISTYAAEETAGNNGTAAEVSGEIIAFGELAPEIGAQHVPLGTEESKLNLPDTLAATVRLGLDQQNPVQEEKNSVTDSVYTSEATGSALITNEGEDVEQTEIHVPVTWLAFPKYDGNTAGVYIFTAEISSFTLGVTPPIITVTVDEEMLKGTITAFAELSDDIRWQNTTEPILPETVRGTVKGSATNIPVTWQADHDYDAGSPEPGLYVFTAHLSGSYTLAQGVEVPRITVYIPAMQRLMMRMVGAGAQSDPLVITTAAQLAEIAALVNLGKLETFLFNDSSATVYLHLGNDLDLSGCGKDWNDGKGWVPIGTSANPFQGHFDGQDKTITGLYINDSNLDDAGLFGVVKEGTVQALGLKSLSISGYSYVGGVAGTVNVNSTIQDCYTTGLVNGYYSGGVAGRVANNSTIQNCCTTTSVSGGYCLGGVAGSVTNGTIQNCYTAGTVRGSYPKVGGVVGEMSNTSSIKNCAALGPNVEGYSETHRILGYKDQYDNLTLSGNVAFIGMTGGGSDNTADGLDGEDITASQIKTDGTIGNRFTAENGWTTQPGQLPGLFGEPVAMPDYIADSINPHFPGEGTANSPFLISTPAQLAKLAELVNYDNSLYGSKYYKLIDDIDLSGYGTSFNDGMGWVPIGTTGAYFNGDFDGGGKTITGLFINTYLDNAGLFGSIIGAVHDLQLTDVQITANDYVGGIVGYGFNTAKVERCSVSGTVIGRINVGGIVGYSLGTIKNCFSTCTVRGTQYVGGIAGQVYGFDSPLVEACYATGAVYGDTGVASYAGGVAGAISVLPAKIINSAALNPRVSGAPYSGTTLTGRVVANNQNSASNLTGNVAFDGILDKDGNRFTTYIGGTRINGADVNADQLQSVANLPTAFSSPPWTFADGSLPGLFGKTVEMPGHITDRLTNFFAGGDGSPVNPYLISIPAQLAKLAELVNNPATNENYGGASVYYKLTANLDLSGYNASNTDFNGGKGWVPIGTSSASFKGNFDGNGKTIAGLYIINSLENTGLFGSVTDSGTIANLALTQVKITSSNDNVGGIVGNAASALVENCAVGGIISGKGYVGSVVGKASDTYIRNCYATGTVQGIESKVGGIVGSLALGQMDGCIATNTVSGYNPVGGIVGMLESNGKLQNCTALNPGITSTGSDTGRRVIGVHMSGSMSNNYAFSGMTGGGNNKTHNNYDGADLPIAQIMSASFWTTAGNWKDGFSWTSAWTIQDGKLPRLTGLEGQSGDGGLYLTERDLQYASVMVNGTYTYTGSQFIPDVMVIFGGEALVQGKDFTIQITSTDGAGTSAGTKVGEVTITVTGKGNFKGTKITQFTIEPIELTEDMVTVEGGPFTYTGVAQQPDVIVQDGDTTLALSMDYENVTYSNNINAGTASVSVTGKGNYQGTVSKDFTIAKAELTITGGTVALKTYDATTTAEVNGITFSGLQNGETLALNTDYKVTGATFDSADAGEGKTVTGTVELLGTGKAGNYHLDNGSLSVAGQTIAKAAAPSGLDQTFEVVKGHAKDYEFDLTTLLPNVTGTLGAVTYTPAITENSDCVLGELAYTPGNTLTLPVQAVAEEGKTAKVTVTIQSGNYNTFDAVISVETVDTILLTITGITVNSKIYDGTDTAALSGTAALITTNIESGDDVVLVGTPSAVFDNANTGKNKTVTITGLSLDGAEAYKYRLDLSGFTGTIEPKELTEAMVTVEGGPFTYNGMAQQPDVILQDGGTTLALSTDYEILTYANNTNAGTARVSITGKGHYTGTVGKDFVIAKAVLTITGGAVAVKTYDNTRDAEITGVSISGLKNSEMLDFGTDYTVTGAEFNSAGAGEGKTVIGTVALLSTPKSDNYRLDDNSFSIAGQTIAKAAVPTGVNRVVEVFERYEADYAFNLNSLLPSVTGTWGIVTYAPIITVNDDGVLKTLDYSSGNTLILPVQSVAEEGKTAEITVTISSDNYNDFLSAITVKTVEKHPVNISGVTMTGGVYNGSPYAYTGTPIFTLNLNGSPVIIAPFAVLYESVDGGGYSSATAPTNAGEYQLTISVPEDSYSTYTGKQSYSFTIEKRPVTVKAEDKSITKDGTLPTFTYTVDGQLSGETALAGTPTLTCAADGKTTGSYPITIDLTGVSYTANYMAAIPGSVDGTLTVNNPSSSGSGGGSSGGSGRASAPVETPKAETKVSGNTATVTTTVKAIVDNSGNAAATASRTQVNDAIDKAVKEAEKQGEGTAARVEIRVEAPAVATTVETIIPKEAVIQASETGIGALTISTPVASITFEAGTLTALSAEITGDVKITASKVEASSLSPEAQRIVGDRPVFDFRVTSGDKTISQFGGNVSVSVPYTPKEGEDANAIVIYYINESGEPEVVSNCIYDPATGMLSFSTRHFSKYAVGHNKVNFKDVAESAWYSKAVGFIAARGITSGTVGGNFSPEAKLTRGQFIVMLMKAYGIAPDTDSRDNFADAGATYYTGYLASAKRLDITAGVGNNMFAPSDEITRQEMFTLLYNALKVIGKLPEGTAGKPLSAFTDAKNIASWAKEAMTLLVGTGTIGGNGGKLSPTSTTTRAEMAQVLYNLLSR